LQAQYETYWKDIGEGKSDFQRNVIGSGKIDETWLTSDAWIPEQILPYTFGQYHVNIGAENFGFWPITIAQKGTYRFQVRRWPKEVNIPINSAPDGQTMNDIYNKDNPVLMQPGKIMPTEKVSLRIGNEHFEKYISSKDEQADFDVELSKGYTDVQAWLIDPKGNEHPAYYVYIDQ
jgi:hypothetical protein